MGTPIHFRNCGEYKKVTFVLAIVILIALILAHEIGHFVTAKLFHVRVDEFGIFLPPSIFGVGEKRRT
jgi:regulator of sigma E protease